MLSKQRRGWRSPQNNTQHCYCNQNEARSIHDENLDVPRELVADHLDADLLAHLEPKISNEVLVDPRLKLAHPTRSLAIIFVYIKAPWFPPLYAITRQVYAGHGEYLGCLP